MEYARHEAVGRPAVHRGDGARQSLIGKGAGLSDSAIRAARAGHGEDTFNDTLADLAVKLVNQRGRLTDDDIAEARIAGIDDGLIVELVAHVALNTLTNYTNHVAATDIDFPVVQL